LGNDIQPEAGQDGETCIQKPGIGINPVVEDCNVPAAIQYDLSMDSAGGRIGESGSGQGW